MVGEVGAEKDSKGGRVRRWRKMEVWAHGKRRRRRSGKAWRIERQKRRWGSMAVDEVGQKGRSWTKLGWRKDMEESHSRGGERKKGRDGGVGEGEEVEGKSGGEGNKWRVQWWTGRRKKR